jgi:hypothetical protein
MNEQQNDQSDPALELFRVQFPTAYRDAAGTIRIALETSPLADRIRKIVADQRCIGGTRFVDF